MATLGRVLPPVVLLAGLSLLAATSCSRQQEGEPLPRTTEVVERAAGDCDDPDAACAEFVARFPRFLFDEVVGTPDEEARRALDASIERMLLASAPGEPTAETLDEQADAFLAGWRDTVELFPDAPVMRWASEKVVEVIEESPRVLSLRLEEYANTGGAHPNSFTSYASFDPATARPYELDDVLNDDALPRLTALAEAAFRAARDLEPDTSLNDAGFYFEGDTFALPANWALVDGGLRLHYNPYEVGPYVLGPTEITLDAATLAPLIDPSGPLGD